MHSHSPTPPTRWGSLSLRLTAVFVAVLVSAAFAVAYLFDRGRAEAVERRELEQLRLDAERGADEVDGFVRRLRADVLFLADTPPIHGIRRALEAGGTDGSDPSTLQQWTERLQQIFLAFGASRPEYFQLRLIGAPSEGHELVRVDRTEKGVIATPSEALQPKGHRYYYQEAARLPAGSIYLSRIDLNQEQGAISLPHQPTLRAATPVYDSAGRVFGVVVLNLDMDHAFQGARALLAEGEALYIADERGDFLVHPEPGRAFAFDLGSTYRLADAFPADAGRIAATQAAGKGFLDLGGPQGDQVAYLTSRAPDPSDPRRRLTFLLSQSRGQAGLTGGALRRESLIGMAGLLALAVVLVIVLVRRLTRSLRVLAAASAGIARGDYGIAMPAADSPEIGSLVESFRHMAGEVERREEALAELTRNLEHRVAARTAELASHHALRELILESIADGVVVTDRDGRFLLWNRKAEEIVGSGPDPVAPDLWPDHFGVFRNEAREPVPAADLPLVRAMRGESAVNVELYLCNPRGETGRWVQVTARPLRSADGEVTGGVAVLLDVTEQRRLRERVEAHRAKLAKVGRLAWRAEEASSAAHQLSQPIAAMANYASAALRLRRQGHLGETELLDLLGRIEELAGQAGATLSKLRALIRRTNPPSVAFDIEGVADSCLDFLGDQLQRHAVRVERRYVPGLPKTIGDPIELEHVLIQLVSNALEAMDGVPPAQRRLILGTAHDSETDRVAIEVADTGPGVSPDLADRLFDPWQTSKPGALGLGLTVAQTIIESRGGRIYMASPESGGARFRIELPIQPVETQA